MAVSVAVSLVQNSQDISKNTSNVTVTATVSWTGGSYNQLMKPGYIIIDGEQYNFSSTFNYSHTTSGSETLTSVTVDVAHNDDGSKTVDYSVSYTTGVSSGTVTASGQSTLTTIPRKSTIESLQNVILGVQHKLVVRKAAPSFTHTVSAICAELRQSETIATKSSTLLLNFTPPLDWAAGNTTGSTVTIYYRIDTYSGDTFIGSEVYTRTAKIPDTVTPTIGTVNISDSKGYAATYGYVKSKSAPRIAFAASGAHGSTISSYTVKVSGKTYKGTTIPSYIDAPIVTEAGSISISIEVTDTRNRTAKSTKSITVVDYKQPAITDLNIKRSSSNGSSLQITFSSSIQPLGNKNKAEYTIKYKKKSETSYTSSAISIGSGENKYALSGKTYTFAADTGASYDVMVSATDAFGTVSKSIVGGTTSKVFSILNGGLGWAFGKVAEKENGLEVAWDIYDKDGDIIRNGAAPTTSESLDTTLKSLILSSNAVPIGADSSMYIHTLFDGTKSANSARTQIAVPRDKVGSIYHRYYDPSTNTWSAWTRALTNKDINVTVAKKSHSHPASNISSGTLPIERGGTGTSGLKMTYGTATIDYGPNPATLTIDFGYTYKSKPVVITSQVFNQYNLMIDNDTITTTGFVVELPGAFTTSGSRAFNWFAIGV